MKLLAAALAGAPLVACQGAPPANGSANAAAGNSAVINDAAAEEEARVDFQSGEIPQSSAAPPPRIGHDRIDAFIADLAAGRREAAIARISSMESVSGLHNAVANPTEFVDKLLRCAFVSARPISLGTGMYDLTWRCPDGDYRSLIDPDWRPPRLTVGQFDSAAALDERRRNLRPPPPPPPRRPGT